MCAITWDELFTQNLLWPHLVSEKCSELVRGMKYCIQCKTLCLVHIPPAIYFYQVLQVCFSAVILFSTIVPIVFDFLKIRIIFISSFACTHTYMCVCVFVALRPFLHLHRRKLQSRCACSPKFTVIWFT